MARPGAAGSARDDFAVIRPAALAAARTGQCIATGWFSRGDGEPLELLTTVRPTMAAGPGRHLHAGVRAAEDTDSWLAASAAGRGKHAAPGPETPAGAAGPGPAAGSQTLVDELPFPEPLLFPAGAWGVPLGGGCFGDLDQLVWVPCPGFPIAPSRAAERNSTANGLADSAPPTPRAPKVPGARHRTVAPRGGRDAVSAAAAEPSLFENALVALMRRPFGWLVVAEPTDLLAAETAELRTELDILGRHRNQRTGAAVERTERRLAELNDFADAGLWSARVLAGASSQDELGVLAPLLAGAVDLGLYRYRLRSGQGALRLADALSLHTQDAVDGAQSPFFVTAGMITALAGLPRLGLPGLSVPGVSVPGLSMPGLSAPRPSVPGPSRGGSAGHHGRGEGAGPGGSAPGTPVAGARGVRSGNGDASGSRNGETSGRRNGEASGSGNGEASGSGNGEASGSGNGEASGGRNGEASGGRNGEAPGSGNGDASRGRNGDGSRGRNADASLGRARAASVDLGVVPDSGEALGVPLAALGRGVLVAGSAGSGKSRTVRTILEQLTSAGVPWLVVDPAGSGYGMADAGQAASQVTVINPCDPDAFPLTLSPLAPEPGYPVLAHIEMVRSLLDVAFDADEPFSLMTSQALRQVYEASGWDLVSGRAVPGVPAAPAIPELRQLHGAIIDLIGQAGYDRQTRARLRGLADARFASLRAGSAGRFLEGGHPADIGELLRRDVVLAVHDVGAGDDRAFIAGALMIRLAEHLRLRAHTRPGGEPGAAPDARRDEPGAGRDEPGPGLRHVIVVEEARGLLRDRGPGRPASRAAERFAALLAEIACYGAATVITERSPALLVRDAVRNAGVRILHRLPARDDREAATGMPDMPGEAAPAGDAKHSAPPRQLAFLEPGVAMVMTDARDRPSWVRVPGEAARGGTRGTAGSPASANGARADAGLPGAGNAALPAAGNAAPLIGGRRSAACGRHCREGRACRLSELHLAEVRAESAEHAWLRVWTETFLLAFLTDSPLPAVPAPLRCRWRSLDARSRECLLARVVDAAVGRRAAALRTSFDPVRLTELVAAAALTRLNGTATAAWGPGVTPPAARPGPAWVIPQLRWLHEAERLCPLDGPGLAPGDQAPPLDFDLVGLPDWPGMRAGQRVRALRRHPLTMELAANRLLAWIALVGEEGPAAFAADLTRAVAGAEPAVQLRHAARLMAVSGHGPGPGWLEVVLSWPRRFITSPARTGGPGDAADCLSGWR
jgi:hypothetical protein